MTTLARVRALPWRDVERPALVMVWVAGGLLAAQALHLYISLGKLGADSHAYWATAHRPDLYGPPPGSVDAFNYSPACAQIVWPLAHLPWPVFCGVWIALEVAAFLWLLRPLGWGWAGALTLVCASEWTIGNVVPFLAIAAVLGMRRPGWWAAVALVKPTMALGSIWFAARGEWRKVGVSALVTVAVVAVSAVVWPGAWVDWLGFLGENGGETGLSVRVAAAVLLTILAARLDARRLLLVAMLLATPVWAGAASLTLLAGLPRMLGHDRTPHLPSEVGCLAVPRGGDPREPIGRGSAG